MGNKDTPLQLSTMESLSQAAECLKTIGHPHRLMMLQMLRQGAFTVGELAEQCGVASPIASTHLRLLQHCGFLSSRKEGRRTYYEIAEPHLENILDCIEGKFGVETVKN